jgi:uncharacterized membrane protein
MKNNDLSPPISIFYRLKRVIDEVGEERFFALIAHHEPDQFHKTLLFRIFNTNIRLCTRCTGIYLGIILTILMFLSAVNIPHVFQLLILFAFPIPAMVDWGLDKYNLWKGSNMTRFVSGFMLGICYIFLWARFIQNPLDIMVWWIAVVYSAIACVIFHTKKN